MDFLRKVLDGIGRPDPPSAKGAAHSKTDLAHRAAAETACTDRVGSLDVARAQPLELGSLPPSRPTPGAPPSPTDQALVTVAGSAKAILILGGAGTGKTTFLCALQIDASRKQVFLAPTGVAALNLGGQTLHSFFGIPAQIINHDEIRIRAPQRKLFRNISRMVIDEISMVRADLLDVVDRTLRNADNRMHHSEACR